MRQRCGFTLIELLVVVAILASLIAILLPALQAVRESGRITQCQNNVKQIGVSLLTFHDSHRSFPHGGWGHFWVGVPELGGGSRQPGGWIYNVLPYCEHADLHGLGLNQSGVAATESYSTRLMFPVQLFTCPSRRSCDTWPVSARFSYVQSPRPYGNVTNVARADYAINSGASRIFSHGGPLDLAQGHEEEYWERGPALRALSGISHLRSAISIRQLIDGSSKTYLVGEKYVDAANYHTGESLGDNESMYAGFCSDLHRFAGALERAALSLPPYAEPLNDHSNGDTGIAGYLRFGSAHSTGLSIVYADGSTHFVSFDIDGDIHFRFGHRFDGGDPIKSLLRMN